jgi:hypothetical protein
MPHNTITGRLSGGRGWTAYRGRSIHLNSHRGRGIGSLAASALKALSPRTVDMIANVVLPAALYGGIGYAIYRGVKKT